MASRCRRRSSRETSSNRRRSATGSRASRKRCSQTEPPAAIGPRTTCSCGATPRLRGIPAGDAIQPAHVDEESIRAVTDALDDSYLFVQGPPGAGKTYIGARLIVDLIERRCKVGITANSHKAIHNLLDEVERVAAERGVSFLGVKKSTKDDPETEYHGAHFVNDEKTLARDDADLVAGTAWAFGAAAMDQRLDYLFIDEAGQVSLPAAIAVMTSARNVVLLGDPLQLSQVTHTDHPGDVGASVLEHLLDGELRPIAPDRGILLTDSYRMHPDVCAFISGLLYEGKLHSAPGRERQAVSSPGLRGTGLRYLPVRHEFNKVRSPEEARVIADEIEQLLRGAVTDVDGVTRPAAAGRHHRRRTVQRARTLHPARAGPAAGLRSRPGRDGR